THPVSLVYVMADGASAEIAVTGDEGLLGVALFLGGLTTPNQAVVQIGGHAYRIKADVIKEEFDQPVRFSIYCCFTRRRCLRRWRRPPSATAIIRSINNCVAGCY